MSLGAQWAIIAVVTLAILGAVLYNGAWHHGYAAGVRSTTAAIFGKPRE